MKILVTCPPMAHMIDEFRPRFAAHGLEADVPPMVQIVPEAELLTLVPQYDGWIIGDDPATRAVLAAGKRGRLKAAVKWGVGVDNVDFAAARELNLPLANTPGMFGHEVADVAMGYVTGLARHLFTIDRGVRNGEWPKPAGISLAGKTVALVGYGDIGRQVARRLLAADMHVVVYDPAAPVNAPDVAIAEWAVGIDQVDFIVLTCALTPTNRHMVNANVLASARKGVLIVNVARGPLIDQAALIAALHSGHVGGAALDVFETEPMEADSALRRMPQCVLGSHNASNTVDAVRRTSERAIDLLVAGLRGEGR